jgi:hypothetical protein
MILLLRLFFKTVLVGFLVKTLGRFFPILLRLLRLWR